MDADRSRAAPRGALAGVQDRDRAGPVLKAFRRPFPFINRVFVDAAYASDRLSQTTRMAVEIPNNGLISAFAVRSRRWAVERLFAWLGRNRRLAKEVEETLASATVFLSRLEGPVRAGITR